MNISIIIPTLNEALLIKGNLARLQALRKQGVEVIVVDGGSGDSTPSLAAPLADQVLHTSAGRARQMNAGAEHASGDVFLFLHADTAFDKDITPLFRELSSKQSYWGRFDIRLTGEGLFFRIIERLINLRSRTTSIATGDQAIFVSRELFFLAGGYPDIAIMEDIALSKKLRKQNKPVCLDELVITSSRRWEEHGVIKTIMKMWLLRLKFMLGSSPESLAGDYDQA